MRAFLEGEYKAKRASAALALVALRQNGCTAGAKL